MGHTLSFSMPLETRLTISPRPHMERWLQKLGVRRNTLPQPRQTLFTRDLQPFELLERTVLPGLLARGERSLRIGVVDDATGRDAYGLAITACEHFPALAALDLKIIALDVPEAARRTAEAGVYQGLEKHSGLPLRLLLKYFERRHDGWHMSSRLRAMVSFQTLTAGTQALPKLDLVVDRSATSRQAA